MRFSHRCLYFFLGTPFTEGYFLRAKMYHIESIQSSSNNKSTAKGITRRLKEKLLKRDAYRKALFSPSVEKLKMVRIGQKKHRVYTLEESKRGLSSFNDKIWMRKVGAEEWDTHSFGHKNITV